MKVTFIDHSGFLVELENAFLLFDYYTGKIDELQEGKPLYVFVSHKHQDHFNPMIFSMFQDRSDVTFIMSNDTKMNEKYMIRKKVPEHLWNRIFYIGKSVTKQFDNITVETLRSTDEGVAFLVTVDGKQIYHAGDLNWWSWEGETDEYNNNMEANYKREIDKLAGRKVDIAFLPLDPRLETRASWGMEYFLKVVKVDKVYPMHLWGQFDLIQKVMEIEELKPYRDNIVMINETGQAFQ